MLFFEDYRIFRDSYGRIWIITIGWYEIQPQVSVLTFHTINGLGKSMGNIQADSVCHRAIAGLNTVKVNYTGFMLLELLSDLLPSHRCKRWTCLSFLGWSFSYGVQIVIINGSVRPDQYFWDFKTVLMSWPWIELFDVFDLNLTFGWMTEVNFDNLIFSWIVLPQDQLAKSKTFLWKCYLMDFLFGRCLLCGCSPSTSGAILVPI